MCARISVYGLPFDGAGCYSPANRRKRRLPIHRRENEPDLLVNGFHHRQTLCKTHTRAVVVEAPVMRIQGGKVMMVQKTKRRQRDTRQDLLPGQPTSLFD